MAKERRIVSIGFDARDTAVPLTLELGARESDSRSKGNWSVHSFQPWPIHRDVRYRVHVLTA